MKEEKLQSDVARKFSELHPDKRGQLFHVSNERNSTKQAFRAKAIGIVSGVADFIFFSSKFNVATELKTPNSRHKKSHIEVQLWWAKIWEAQGGIWRLCRTVDEAISCYDGNPKGMTIKDVEALIKETNRQTIKF